MAVDGFTIMNGPLPSNNNLQNQFPIHLWGGFQLPNSLDQESAINWDPNYALPIEQSLALYAENDTALGETSNMHLYVAVWESSNITPPEPQVTKTQAQSVNQSWQ